jgi:hypothetical protein
MLSEAKSAISEFIGGLNEIGALIGASFTIARLADGRGDGGDQT